MKKRNGFQRNILLGAIALGVGVLAMLLLMNFGPVRGQAAGTGSVSQTVMRMYNGYRDDFAGVEEIDAREAMDKARAGNALFVDVRDKEERDISMLPNAITEKDFLEHIDKYKGRTIIAYCTIGYRSGKFAQKLQKEGARIYNLKGGVLAWVGEGGKVYDTKGETNRVHVYGSKWNLLPPGYEAVW